MSYNDDRSEEQFHHPYVNLNGDGVESLIKDRRTTMDALREAISCLSVQYPHGRNYQGAPPGAYEKARAIHRSQVEALEWVLDQVQAEAIFLYKNYSRL